MNAVGFVGSTMVKKKTVVPSRKRKRAAKRKPVMRHSREGTRGSGKPFGGGSNRGTARDRRGANPCELGLDRYVLRIRERLRDAIEPDESLVEAPLLPLLNRYKPMGTTADVDFTTKRPVHATERSHVNAVVLDSNWEQTAAFFLELSKESVKATSATTGLFYSSRTSTRA